MEFDFTVPYDSLDKVPEQFRPLFKDGGDGKFSINNTDPTVKGAVEAVIGLNKSLKAARLEAKAKTPVDLSPLADYGKTPEEIKTAIDAKLQAAQDELAKGGQAKLNLDKIRQEMTDANAENMKKANTRAEALQNQLYVLMVENAATAAVAELKGVPELLLPFIRNQVKVVEEDGKFNVYVVDVQGDRRYSGVTGQPMTIKELVTEMKANEKFGRLFESQAPAGGGLPPGRVGTPPKTGGPAMTATQKIAAGLAKGQHQTRAN